MNNMNKLTIAMITIFLVFNCSSKGGIKGSQLKNATDYKTEGWLDDNTFQVRSLGAPNPKAKGFVRRRSQAKDAALTMSQKRVVELMIGAKVQGACGVDSGESTGCAVTKEFGANLKGGYIVKSSFDKQDNCEVTFRIHANGLKKMAEAEISRLNNQ